SGRSATRCTRSAGSTGAACERARGAPATRAWPPARAFAARAGGGRSLAALALHLGEQLVDRGVHLLIPRVLEADHALVVDHVDRRPAGDVPAGADRALRAIRTVPEGTPGDLLLGEALLQRLEVGVGVHADQREGLVLQSFHERPLVRVHGPAGASPVAPEVEHDDLAAVVAELEGHAVEVDA